GYSSLSVEIAGQRCIKSFYNSFLRAWAGKEGDVEGTVDMASKCTDCEHWTIESIHGKVALKSNCLSDKYLRGNSDGSVDLADYGPSVLWTPVKDNDGSWSLRSNRDTWLRAQPHGRVSQQDHRLGDEHFSIEEW
ncbi:hypothetical protein PENTCL1PPCAC_16847, partial [Pristionchus entomophagus]